MAVTIAGTALKKMTHNGQAVKKWVHDGVQVFSAEEIIIPNPTDYPSSIYDVTMLNSGGTLTVDSSGAMVKTTSTDYGQKHLACLRIDVSKYTTLEYTALLCDGNDGNYKRFIGFGSAVAETLDILTLANNWYSTGSVSGTLDVTNYDVVYAIFGQGTTIAYGNYGHGTTGFTSIVLK